MLCIRGTFRPLLLCAVLLGLPLRGQEEAIFRAESRLVVLHTTVVDRNGKLVTDLPEKSFKVFENGVEQPIKIFRREDIPVSLGLVIDGSASMRDKREKVEAAALQLVKASNSEDQVFIVNFNDEAYLDCPFTNSISKLEEGLSRIDSRGSTALYSAVSMSIDYVRKGSKLDKKILFVVSDGENNLGSSSVEQVIKEAQQAEVVIYSIGLLSEEDRGAARRAKRDLDMITEATGGLPYYPEQLTEVNAIALRVAHEVRNQYTIAYTPSNAALDGSYRQIRVSVEGPDRPVARTRTGYYATPAKPASK